MANNQILITIITVLALFGLHYFPWRKLLGRELGRLEAFVFGAICLIVPPSFVVPWEYAQVYCLCLLGGGGAVISFYYLDNYFDLKVINSVLKAENQILRNEATNDPKDNCT